MFGQDERYCGKMGLAVDIHLLGFIKDTLGYNFYMYSKSYFSTISIMLYLTQILLTQGIFEARHLKLQNYMGYTTYQLLLGTAQNVIGVPLSDIIYLNDFFPDYYLLTTCHFSVNFNISFVKIFGFCLCQLNSNLS